MPRPFINKLEILLIICWNLSLLFVFNSVKHGRGPLLCARVLNTERAKLSCLAAWLCAACALSIPQDLYQQNLLDDFDLSAPSRHFATLIKNFSSKFALSRFLKSWGKIQTSWINTLLINVWLMKTRKIREYTTRAKIRHVGTHRSQSSSSALGEAFPPTYSQNALEVVLLN